TNGRVGNGRVEHSAEGAAPARTAIGEQAKRRREDVHQVDNLGFRCRLDADVARGNGVNLLIDLRTRLDASESVRIKGKDVDGSRDPPLLAIRKAQGPAGCQAEIVGC